MVVLMAIFELTIRTQVVPCVLRQLILQKNHNNGIFNNFYLWLEFFILYCHSALNSMSVHSVGLQREQLQLRNSRPKFL
jgi:hypothetical protein